MVKKLLKYGGAALVSAGIILVMPVIVHPDVSGTDDSHTATVVSITTGNTNTMRPEETCTIVFRTGGELIPITETPEYCRGVRVGDTMGTEK